MLLLGAGWLAAQDAPPAQGIRQLEVRNHQGQSYWMFVPSSYTAGRAWPILYCLDPGRAAACRWSVSHWRRRRPAS